MNYEPLHKVEREAIEREPEIGKADVSLCLHSWIRSFCDNVENHVGCELSASACQALAHTLIAARARQHRLISERDEARRLFAEVKSQEKRIKLREAMIQLRNAQHMLDQAVGDMKSICDSSVAEEVIRFGDAAIDSTISLFATARGEEKRWQEQY